MKPLALQLACVGGLRQGQADKTAGLMVGRALMKSPTQASVPRVILRVKLTYDDFVLFPDERAGSGTNWSMGRAYVTPSPNTRHQQISGDLFALIVIPRRMSFVSTDELVRDSTAP